MFILIFLPVYLSIFFVVVFKILVSSVSDVGDSPASVVFTIRNPDGGLTWQAGGVYLLKGSKVDELPDVNPGKINVRLMTY